ncbi:hypothetical protein F2P56_037216 [Juglans regia]|uniref:Uncharacterized protein LOC109013386 n=2 Tax=Juglans regia TaxID=51240 RepID=A0A2I4H4B5_JUGRE|nr:uncharacterized protein LOC109013386 [Juglans regia]XP_035543103.1 uncharacterized protein LOC109013386 [Juglans regia]KAF5441841.1 hypothetical protein F2P56_037216 [Juglans regia]
MEETRVNYIDFIHEHPLVFKEDLENDGNKEAVCSRCQEPVLGPCYKFSKRNFLLHKSCNEPPLEIHRHPLHPNHTLILCAPSKYVACDACYMNCSIRLFYSCKQCEFDIDIRCVSRRQSNIDECQRHDFFPILKQIQFTCDACGEETEGIAFLCSTCRFMVHRQCVDYPRTITTTVHNHSLTLTCSLFQMVGEKDDILCKLCQRKVKIWCAVYYCQDCRYAAHFQCARSVKGEYMDRSSTIESDLVSEIEHSSHEHKLIISKKKLEDDKICEGCMLSISPPFYSCEQCNFFLHGSCTKLLPKKQLPLFHQHPLTLLSQAPSPSGIFQCDACDRFQPGFCYRCDLCKYYKLDIQCASLPETLKHKGHQHSLSIALNRDRIVCNGCYDEDPPPLLFVCTECKTFGLCFRCATLPYRVRYEYDLHDYLTLRYSVEDDSGEYYCFICEESRDSRKWFYYCKECDFAAHPDCVIGKYSRIKFGRTFTCRKYHDQHQPLTIVQKNEYSAPCVSCGTTFHGLAVACTLCKFNSHLLIRPWWGLESICAPQD